MSKRQLCHSPGCFNLTDARYCEAHAWKQAEEDKAKAAGATRRWAEHHASSGYEWVYHDPRWRRIAARRRKAEPFCRECAREGIQTPGKVVDHVQPHKGDESLAFDYENTQTLCWRHSNRKSRGER